MILRGLAAAATVLFYFAVLLMIALAHPGRLDKDGCHHVGEDYEYESGNVLKKGERHCHRPLGKMRLDGKERLQDPNDEGMPVKDKRRIERRGYE